MKKVGSEKVNIIDVTSCVFCTTSPDDVWLSSKYAIALPSAKPVTPGHVVVAPLRHVSSFYELDVEEQHGLWELVSEVRQHLITNLAVETTVVGFEDASAGEGHTHIHVVPGRPGISLPGGIEWVAE